MISLKKFLESCRTRNKVYNFVCLHKGTGIFKQGTFFIPQSRAKEFWHLYSLAFPNFTENDCPSLVYAAKKLKCVLQPLFIDVDLEYEEETKLDSNIHQKFTIKIAEKLVELLKKPVDYFIVAKDEGYFKKIQYKSGFHIYFPNIRIPISVARDIKEYAESIVLDFYTPTNNPKKIIDAALIERRNGLMLMFDFKLPKTGGRYNLIRIGGLNDGKITDNMVDDEFLHKECENIMSQVYKFIWEKPTIQEEKAKTVPKIKRKKPPTKFVVNEKQTFNLDKFLEATSLHRPTHKEFLQIVYFCASISHPRADMKLLDNRRNSCPYVEYDRREPNRDAITRGSMIWYLNEYGVNYEFEEIFPRKIFTYYSEYKQFLYYKGNVWNPEILAHFCADVFSYAEKEKKFIFKDFELIEDGCGNFLKKISITMQDKFPFSHANAIVRVPYEKKILLKIVKKRLPRKNLDSVTEEEQQIVNFNRLLKKKPTKQDIKRIVKELELDPCTLKMSTLLKDRLDKGYIKRYKSVTFAPFLWVDKTRHDVFNTFTRFPMIEYTPTIKKNWRDSHIFEFILNAYADGDSKILEGILKLFAFWIQHPDKRDERIVVLISKEHGIGKTSLNLILKALMGNEYIVFFNSYGEFEDAFNMALANKLYWFLDDISGISKSQALSLNSKVTSEVMKFNEKNERALWLNISTTLILTSNDVNPLYCPEDDRRQMYIKVNPLYKNNRPFFKKLRSELKDLNIMYSMFMDLATLDLHGWEPTSQNDPFQEFTNKQKEKAMKASYVFIIQFFQDHDWYTQYVPYRCNTWCNGIQISVIKQGADLGKTRIRILKGQLFSMFKEWNKDKNPGCRTVKQNTFFQHIGHLGIFADGNKHINGKQRNVVDLIYINIRNTVKQIFPEFKMGAWPSENAHQRRLMIEDMRKSTDFPFIDEEGNDVEEAKHNLKDYYSNV